MGARRSLTARGMLERTERSYTVEVVSDVSEIDVMRQTKITSLLNWSMGCD